ncbi:hypothetical protein ACFIQG_18355, partial [Comamonas odontotermitis]|uniref:hypothetical protein n=1 Tax=Comamonas odontotermitis TaxID=379895 RepID=UPI0036701D38
MKPTYMSEAWFSILQARVDQPGTVRAHIAKQLGIGPAALSQVLNASGEYGKGTASTSRIADKVTHTFGRYACPHLTDEASGEECVITAEQCRAYAHRPAPTAPREMKHWQACNRCVHKESSAPPVPRAVQHRKVIPITTAPQEA